jgi:hypothetical protein
MATLGITVGPLTGERQYDDAVAADVLLKFCEARCPLPGEATQQQKLDAIVAWIEGEIVRGAREHEYEVRRRTLRDEVDSGIGLE